MTASELAMLNVGQGDCFVIHDPKCATAMIIDCPFGGRNAPLTFIADRKITTISALVVTHLHDDHYGGIPHVLAALRPDSLFFGIAHGYRAAHPEADAFLKRMLADIRRHNISDYGLAHEGKRIAFGDVVVELLAPNDQEVLKAQPSNNPNHASAIMRAEFGGLTALLGGDATPWRWKALLDRGVPLRADVLVFPHHGARFMHRFIDVAALLAEIQPRVILLSAGAANGYGHPDARTLAALRAYAQSNQARLVCTQLNEICRIAATRAGGGVSGTRCAGTVIVSDDAGVVRVATEVSAQREIVNGILQPELAQQPLRAPQCAPVAATAP